VKTMVGGYTTIHNIEFKDMHLDLQTAGIGVVVSKLLINDGATGNGTVQSGGNKLYAAKHIQSAVIDCKIDGNHYGEFTIRAQGCDRFAVISNHLLRSADGKGLITYRGWSVLSQPNGVVCQHGVVAANLFDGSIDTIDNSNVTSIAPTSNAANQILRNITFENNFYYDVKATFPIDILASNVSFRNNVINLKNVALSNSVFRILDKNATMSVLTDSVKIYNNTVYTLATEGLSLVFAADQITNMDLRGNLSYSPNKTKSSNNSGTTPTLLTVSYNGGVTPTIANNSTNAQMKSTDPLFVGPATTQAGYKLQSGSYAKDAGVNVNVRMDGLGFNRAAPTFDMGALNAPDKQVPARSLINTTVTPVLTASLTSAVAPFGVVFDGVATTTSNAGIDTFHDYIYYFDFGDGGAANYTYGQLAGQTKNRFVGGPVAAYVYETHGSYTARMWVSDGVSVWGPVSQTITVQDPDVVYAGTNTICVSSSGNFAGAPAGHNPQTSSSFTTMMTSFGTTGKRVLFRAGETFNCTASSIRSGVNGLYIGTFGGTSQAIINATVSLPATQMLQSGDGTDWRLHNLHFSRTIASGFTDNSALSVGTSARRWTIHNCRATNVSGFVSPLGGENMVVSKLVTSNMNEGVASSGTCSILGNGNKLMGIVDCDLDNSHGIEHVLRLQGAEKSCIISNRIARTASGKSYLTLRGFVVAFPGYTSRWTVVANNYFDGSGSTASTTGMSSISPQNTTSYEELADVIWENNFYHTYLESTVLQLLGVRLSVRSNVIYRPANAGNSSMLSFELRDNTGYTSNVPSSSALRIHNNSTYDLNSVGNGSLILVGTNVTASSINNNIYYAPNLTKNANNNTSSGPYTIGGARATVFTPNTVSTGFTYSNNSSDVQCKSTDPLWVGPATTQAGYKLQSGSYAKNAAVDVKVRMDALKFLRVGATFDMGALNAPDKQVDAWTIIP
jgi:hypothetical protein